MLFKEILIVPDYPDHKGSDYNILNVMNVMNVIYVSLMYDVMTSINFQRKLRLTEHANIP
jgi:hypothetical protein